MADKECQAYTDEELASREVENPFPEGDDLIVRGVAHSPMGTFWVCSGNGRDDIQVLVPATDDRGAPQ